GNARTRVLGFRQRAPVLRPPSFRMRRARWVHARWSRPAPTPHALERYARALEPIAVRIRDLPRVAAGEEAEAWARGWLASWRPATAALAEDDDPSWIKRRPPVAMCPAARHWTKRWPEPHWLAQCPGRHFGGMTGLLREDVSDAVKRLLGSAAPAPA